MITARHYYFLDEKGIADNPSGPNKITVFGVTKYLPIPCDCGNILKTNEEECTGVCFECSLPDDE